MRLYLSMNVSHILSFLIILLSLSACQQEKSLQFLALSHTRICDGTGKNTLDTNIANINYAKYDLLLLGGDMLCNTSMDEAGLQHLSDVLGIEESTTLWAIGNHDDTDTALLSRYTQRPTYYSYHHSGITFLVLDTELDVGSISGQQLDYVNRVLDTLQHTTHLIVLHHKLLWLYGNDELKGLDETVSNVKICEEMDWCLKPNNFNQDIYPRLTTLVRKQGIQVICIGGDIGSVAKQFEWTTKEGITLLATGVNDDKGKNQVLIFDFYNGELKWFYQTVLN